MEQELVQLYEEYYEKVFRYLFVLCKNRELAEDLASDTFYKAFLKIDTFSGTSSIYGWLCQIGKNLYYNHLRKEKRLVPFTQEHSYEDEVGELLEDRELAAEIYQKLHELQEPYKEVFMLRTLGNLSFREIGNIFQHSENWARVTFYRGKSQLIQLMEGEKKK